MNARVSRTIRKLIYGNMSTRLPINPKPWERARLKRVRAIYLRAKRSYKNGACMMLIMDMALGGN